MAFIRLHYSTTEIEPKILLHHFLRYIGFYVEENAEENFINEEEALVEIYIVSNEYVDEHNRTLDIKQESRTILICKDGWMLNNDNILIMQYEQFKTQNEFLNQLVHNIAIIMRTQGTTRDILAENLYAWEIAAKNVAKQYLSNNMLLSALYTRCFYKQTDLFHMALHNYTGFIESIRDNATIETDVETYAQMYAMYEWDLICEKNETRYDYTPEEIIYRCEELLQKNSGNEQLLVTHADIRFELMNAWSRACDEYKNPLLQHCAYSKYRFGRIVRIYLKEYENAAIAFKMAIRQKSDYFSAWYQLGLCYEGMGEYEDAVRAYRQVSMILKNKYARHLLAPIELEYLYKSFLKIALVYRNRLEDSMMARRYDELAERVRQEVSSTIYLEKMFPEVMRNETLREAIIDAMEERLSIQMIMKG